MSEFKVLVTGASGFLGRRIVEMLGERGFAVRALVRRTSRIADLAQSPAEIAFGDVTDVDSLRKSFEGIDYVVHAAADNSGTENGARKVTIQGTRNILDLCAAFQVKKLVYISSCSVYGPADYEDGQVINENTLLERLPELRGIYSWAKLRAEKVVFEYMNENKVSAVCLRPGTIYGPGGENFSPAMGFSRKNRFFVVISRDKYILPLVYVDNVVDAVIKAMTLEKSTGQVYNVVDPERIDKKRFMDAFIRRLYPGAHVFYLPYNFLSILVAMQEQVFKMTRRKPVLSRYRLVSSQQPILIDSSKITSDLGWVPSVSFDEAVERIIARHSD